MFFKLPSWSIFQTSYLKKNTPSYRPRWFLIAHPHGWRYLHFGNHCRTRTVPMRGRYIVSRRCHRHHINIPVAWPDDECWYQNMLMSQFREENSYCLSKVFYIQNDINNSDATLIKYSLMNVQDRSLKYQTDSKRTSTSTYDLLDGISPKIIHLYVNSDGSQ